MCNSERRLLQMHLVEDRKRSVDIISVHQAKRVFPVSCIAQKSCDINTDFFLNKALILLGSIQTERS